MFVEQVSGLKLRLKPAFICTAGCITSLPALLGAHACGGGGSLGGRQLRQDMSKAPLVQRHARGDREETGDGGEASHRSFCVSVFRQTMKQLASEWEAGAPKHV